MHKYLHCYAAKWDLLDRMSLNTQVLEVEKLRGDQDGSWRIISRTGGDGTAPLDRRAPEIVIKAKKLIVATGVTQRPNLPAISGQKSFNAPVFHSASLGRDGARLIQDENIRKVAVLGGGKSAYDAVYMFASAGREVEWIIRKSGRGTVWVLPRFTAIGPFSGNRSVILAAQGEEFRC